MKQVFTILMLMFVFATSSMAQAEKTFIKSIPMQTASLASLELPGEVVATEWDKDYLRITITVDLTNSSEDILKRLATVGRYDLQTREEGDVLIVDMPKMAQLVTIKGVDLHEVLKFEVFYPKNTEVKTTLPKYHIAAHTL